MLGEDFQATMETASQQREEQFGRYTHSVLSDGEGVELVEGGGRVVWMQMRLLFGRRRCTPLLSPSYVALSLLALSHFELCPIELWIILAQEHFHIYQPIFDDSAHAPELKPDPRECSGSRSERSALGQMGRKVPARHST
jgi:hypothetical protein